MGKSRKVAIVGAGPSGLVTAKTLLHNYPAGTFEPIVFEKSCSVGGLWSVKLQKQPDQNAFASGDNRHADSGPQSPDGYVSPSMLTNLSRFTVAFSDLAWESVDLSQEPSSIADENLESTSSAPPPLFPKAWQVGKYLQAYADRYIPPGVLRLGCQVVGTEKRPSDKIGGGGWVVEWTERGAFSGTESDNAKTIKREEFDYLVVASGYFSVPHIPDIAGLSDFQDRVVHSSALRDVPRLWAHWNGPESPPAALGKLVVIGGSFSGAEAASTLALHLSSSAHSPNPTKYYHPNLTVHHITSRPFWIVPTFLPSTPQIDTSSVTFLPMDLIMYDLSRRPPGEINYAFGPVPRERSIMVNDYFENLVGTDQQGLGGGQLTLSKDSIFRTQPPWIALADSYAEYVRAGQVQVTIGRLRSIIKGPDHMLGKLEIDYDSGEKVFLNDVVAVVFATGFKPFPSLSFLPREILSRLEYTEDDSFLTIVLDDKGVSHAGIPDLGFVGFYRGAFWGVAEMQARSLAEQWFQRGREVPSSTLIGVAADKRKEESGEREKFYELRRADPRTERAQFPMGDYVGLMETFARDLGIRRVAMTEKEQRNGPIVSARYQIYPLAPKFQQAARKDGDITLKALQASLSASCVSEARQHATSKAIFRALQGRWLFTRTHWMNSNQSTRENEPQETSGSATFHPRYPTMADYESEYLYEEISEPNQHNPHHSANSIFRFREVSAPGAATHIGVWCLSGDDTKMENEQKQKFSHNVHACWESYQTGTETNTETSGHEDKWAIKAIGKGDSLIHISGRLDAGQTSSYIYTFLVKGVYIVSWNVKVIAPNDTNYIKNAATTTSDVPGRAYQQSVLSETRYKRE